MWHAGVSAKERLGGAVLGWKPLLIAILDKRMARISGKEMPKYHGE